MSATQTFYLTFRFKLITIIIMIPEIIINIAIIIGATLAAIIILLAALLTIKFAWQALIEK